MKYSRLSIWKAASIILIAVILPTGPAAAFTGPESIMGFTTSRTQHQYANETPGLRFVLSASEDPFAFRNHINEPNWRNTHLSMTWRTDPAIWHASVRNRDGDVHTALGGVMDRVTVLAHFGDSEGILSEREGIDGISPNFFHGAVSTPFSYTGLALDYRWSESLAFNAGTLVIESAGYADRSVYFGGFDYKGFRGALYAVMRGDEAAGYRIAAAYRWPSFEIGYQEMFSDTEAWWREVGFSYSGIDTIGSLRLNIGTGQNNLYEEFSDTRVTLTYSIPLGSDKRGKHREKQVRATDETEGLAVSESRLSVLAKGGLSAAGTGLALSSGNAVIDAAPRFRDQNAAAYDILVRWNPVSILNNREYGSTIYRNRDGSYSASYIVVKGTFKSVTFNPHSLAPNGTTATANWHTHGADTPGYQNEGFSPADIRFANYYAVDGYLGTPLGRMFLYDFPTDKIYQFVDVTENEFILPTSID